MNKPRYSNNGFTLIEVMVTLIVILVGLLGIAALQAKSQQAQLEGYQRSQAIILLNDMAARINANHANASSYVVTTDAANGIPFMGVGFSGTLTLTDPVVVADLTAWDNTLKGAAETRSGQNVGAMVGARGCISAGAAANQYVLSVAWQGLNETVAPANTCAKNQYGAETRRRVLSITIQIADLRNLSGT